MAIENIKELRQRLCGGVYAGLYSICEELVSFAEGCGPKDGPCLLREFLEEITISDLIGEELTEEFLQIPPGRQEGLQECLTLENRLVSNLTQSRVSVEEFYRSLWEKMNDSTLITDSYGRAAFLFFLRIDSRIPYFELDEGCVMEDGRYKELVDKIQPAIAKGSFILSANLKYKTQRASLLMDVANGLENEEERIVFWAVLLGRCRAVQQLQRQISQTCGKESRDGTVPGGAPPETKTQ